MLRIMDLCKARYSNPSEKLGRQLENIFLSDCYAVETFPAGPYFTARRVTAKKLNLLPEKERR